MLKILYSSDDRFDVVVFSTFPLCQNQSDLTDDGDADDKILGVPIIHIKNITDMNQHTLKTIQHFFETYKGLQNKVVKVGKIGGAKEAKETFHHSKKLYKEKFGK